MPGPEEVITVDEDLIDPVVPVPPTFTSTIKVYNDQSVADIPVAAQDTDLLEIYDTADATKLAQLYWDTTGNLRLVTQKGDLHVYAKGSTGSDGVLYVHNDLSTTGSLTTGAPTGGAAAWKLGILSVVAPSAANRTVALSVGGTTVYLAARTTND